MKKSKKAGIIVVSCVAGLLFLCTVAYFLVGNYFYNFALNSMDTKMADSMMQTSSGDRNFSLENDWFEKESGYKEIKMKADDGLSLSAYEVNTTQESHNWAITIHGYRSNATANSSFARNFFDKGYNVIMPDLRGHGNSEGEVIGMGYLDRLDILKWIDYIIEKDPESKIVLHGISMGGATVMMTTGETLPSNVKVAVEDCGYTSAYDQFTYILTGEMNLPEFPVMSASNQVTRLRGKYDLEEASAVEQVKKSKTPTLFIHGDKDAFVPSFMLDLVFDASNAPKKTKYVVKDAEHGLASSVDPEGYWKAIWDFVDPYMS